MMTTLMDNVRNLSNLSSRERVQYLLNKNIELEKRRRKAARDKSSDHNLWLQMRENYETILLEDLDFCDENEIELKLWLLHHQKIEEFRSNPSGALASTGPTTPQNGRGPPRAGPDRNTKNRQFKTFLSEASGFYHDLMVKISAKYGLPLNFFTSDQGNQILSEDGNMSADVRRSLISCHQCYIYLGDLARYKGLYGEPESKAREHAAASSYYAQASSLCPSKGNPHHQLAILANYSGDEFVTIYRYFRSLAVENPFATARDNLTIAFEKNRQSYSQLLADAKAPTRMAPVKMTGGGRGRGEARVSKSNAAEANIVKERIASISEILKSFRIRFIRVNGILFTRTSLETFEEVFTSARTDLLQLLASGKTEKCNFGSDAADCSLVFIRLIAVLIFTVHNVKRESENQSYAEILQKQLLLQNALTATFEFMGYIIERCTQLDDPSMSFMLPAILVFVEWLACQQDIAVGSTKADEKENRARSIFWNACITFLNKLLSTSGFSISDDEDETCFFNMGKYDEGETSNRLALLEDVELRGFLPLLPAQQILDFSRKHAIGNDGIKEKQARIHRIIAAGKALANLVQVGQHKIYFDSKVKRFAIGMEPQVSDDYLLSSSPEMQVLSGAGEESFQASPVSLKPLELKPQYSIEGEEEDEVIVFKPSVIEKHANGIVLDQNFPESLVNGANINEVGAGNHVGPVPISYAQQTTLQPATSNWRLENEVPLVKELTNLSLLENGFPVTRDLQDRFGALQPTDSSVPFSYQSVSVSAGNKYPVQLPETLVPSKFDSIMSSGIDMGIVSTKASNIAPASLKKNPVSRPLRHSGPPPGFSSISPPGFSSIPLKQIDVPLSELMLKNHHPTMDDYTWLDGYGVPSSTQGIGSYSSVNQPSQLYHPANKTSGSTETVSFPFPGKQVQPMQVQGGKQNGWLDYQFSEQLKLYQGQHQQLANGNQQSVALPEQYHGQSLWEGRFFV